MKYRSYGGGTVMNNEWVEIFGMFYLKHFIDEQHDRVLRMNGSLFVQWDYLEEL